MSQRVVLSALALTLVAGCGGSDGAKPDATDLPPAEPVCDGTTRLRLRFFTPGQPSREVRGSGVRVENGFPSFAVDGQCAYWMNAGWFNAETNVDARDLDWRSGQVDAELEADLNELPLKHLDTLGDCMPHTIFDGAPRVISDGVSGAACTASGPRHAAALEIVSARATDLWARGSAMTGGIWISAVPVNDGDTSKSYRWPATKALSSFILPVDESGLGAVGLSQLVEELEIATELRLLKAQYVEDRKVAPGSFFDGQKMTDGTTEALVYMRDELPYEDEFGLLPLGIPQ